MNWPVFLIVALVVMVIAGLTAGWLLPMAGVESSFLTRAICFGVAGGIVGLMYVKMKGAPRA